MVRTQLEIGKDNKALAARREKFVQEMQSEFDDAFSQQDLSRLDDYGEWRARFLRDFLRYNFPGQVVKPVDRSTELYMMSEYHYPARKAAFLRTQEERKITRDEEARDEDEKSGNEDEESGTRWHKTSRQPKNICGASGNFLEESGDEYSRDALPQDEPPTEEEDLRNEWHFWGGVPNHFSASSWSRGLLHNILRSYSCHQPPSTPQQQPIAPLVVRAHTPFQLCDCLVDATDGILFHGKSVRSTNGAVLATVTCLRDGHDGMHAKICISVFAINAPTDACSGLEERNHFILQEQGLIDAEECGLSLSLPPAVSSSPSVHSGVNVIVLGTCLTLDRVEHVCSKCKTNTFPLTTASLSIGL